MRIGIDFTSAARERAGIGRYARELVRALARRDSPHTFVLFIPRDALADLVRWEWPRHFALVRAPLTERALAALWHRVRLPLPVEAFIGRTDVFYSPDFLLPPTLARRTLVTVHDLSYVRVPECFPEVLKRYLNQSVPRAVRRADLVLADAESTRRDIVEVYAASPEKVRVLYSGVDPRFAPAIPAEEQQRVRTRLGLVRPYLLSVSTIQPRKNYARLIEAFARLKTECDLVIAGGKGWMYDEVYDAVDRLGLKERVRFAGFVSDEDLPALYAGATLFVYPSLYEGFGLPVAEAMACGVPVVSSDASSLPEVAGDAALYFDPRSVEAMAAALERALGDAEWREGARVRGRARIKPFTWDRAAQELLKHFEG